MIADRPQTLGVNRGFTFVETLAALALLAVLVPVALQGVRVASRIGEVADRKREAAMLAEQRLLEAIVIDQWRQGRVSGDFGDDWPDYSWTLDIEDWRDDIMRMVTLQVFFTVQGEEYSVGLSTLAPKDQPVESSGEEESA